MWRPSSTQHEARMSSSAPRRRSHAASARRPRTGPPTTGSAATGRRRSRSAPDASARSCTSRKGSSGSRSPWTLLPSTRTRGSALAYGSPRPRTRSPSRERPEAAWSSRSRLSGGAASIARTPRRRDFGRGSRSQDASSVGRRYAVWSNIHVDDAATAFVAAAEAGRGGLWHVVDDRPATMAEFFRTLADLLGRRGLAPFRLGWRRSSSAAGRSNS